VSLFTELPRGLVVLGMRVSGIPSSRKLAFRRGRFSEKLGGMKRAGV
jgi:hypothetical protein